MGALSAGKENWKLKIYTEISRGATLHSEASSQLISEKKATNSLKKTHTHIHKRLCQNRAAYTSNLLNECFEREKKWQEISKHSKKKKKNSLSPTAETAAPIKEIHEENKRRIQDD